MKLTKVQQIAFINEQAKKAFNSYQKYVDNFDLTAVNRNMISHYQEGVINGCNMAIFAITGQYSNELESMIDTIMTRRSKD